MFHWQKNIFFGRRADGSVRILAFRSPPADFPDVEGEHDAAFDETIPVDQWASIIASVSAGSEIDNRFYAAKDFHKSVGPIQIVFDRRQ